MNKQVVSVTIPPVVAQSHSHRSMTGIAQVLVRPPSPLQDNFSFELIAENGFTLPAEELKLVFAEDESERPDEFAQHCQRAIIRYRMDPRDEGDSGQRWGFVAPGLLREDDAPLPCRLRHEISTDARELRLEIDRVQCTDGTPVPIPFRFPTICFATAGNSTVDGRVRLTQDPSLIITRPQDPA